MLNRLIAFLLLFLPLLVAAENESIEFASKGIFAADISRDGRYSVIGSIHQGASLWDLKEQSRLYSWNHQKSAPSVVIATAFSPDSRFAVTAGSAALVVRELIRDNPYVIGRRQGKYTQ